MVILERRVSGVVNSLINLWDREFAEYWNSKW